MGRIIYQKIHSPNLVIFDYYLGEWGGHLHRVGTWRPWTSLLTVFELKEDRSGWNVKYHGDFRACIYTQEHM